VSFAGDDTLIPPQHRIEREKEAVASNDGHDETGKSTEAQASGEQGGNRRRRRKPQRRGRGEDSGEVATETVTAEASTTPETAAEEAPTSNADASGETDGETKAEDGRSKRRRRGRRGGRRRGQKTSEDQGETREAREATGEAVPGNTVSAAALEPASTPLDPGLDTPSEDGSKSQTPKPQRRHAARRPATKNTPKFPQADSETGRKEETPTEESHGGAQIEDSHPAPEPMPAFSTVAPSMPGREPLPLNNDISTVVDVGPVESPQKTPGAARTGWWKRLTE